MDFRFSEEQQALVESARDFLASHSGPEDIRTAMTSELGYDKAVWQQIATELGWPSVHIPETYGGLGLGYVDLVVLMETMGEALLCSPFFSTIALAANAILTVASETQKQELLPAIAEGRMTATLALSEKSGRWDASAIEATARPEGDGFILDGLKTWVVDGHSCDLLLVAARRPGTRGEDGICVFALPGHTPGLDRRVLTTMDQTRRLADLELAVRSTDLATKMPADSLLYLETRDLGAAIKTIVAQLKPMLTAQGNDKALSQIEALLGTGLDSYLDWVQDIGVGVSLSAAGPSVGIVATVTDAATGQQRIDSLLTLVRAISATADPSPVEISSEDVNGVKVTSIALTEATGVGAGLPVEPRITVAIDDAHFYLGLGDFAKDALARDPADSLASAEGYSKALAAAGENAGVLFVDVASVLGFAELMMSSDQRDMFESQIKPYADALDVILASIGQDETSTNASLMLFVK